MADPNLYPACMIRIRGKPAAVDARRAHILQPGTEIPGAPILYWMSRDQRAPDNWALLYAQQTALRLNAPLVTAFCAADSFLGATRRHYGFMLRGLEETRSLLTGLQIPFLTLRGHPPEEIMKLADTIRAGMVVCDFDPLRIKRKWQTALCRQARFPVVEIDAHNIVPTRQVSRKREYGAYTLRPKLNRLLPEFLTEFPRLRPHPYTLRKCPHSLSPLQLLDSLPLDRSVDEVTSCTAGSKAAGRQLDAFLKSHIDQYAGENNNPNSGCRSNLSPYLHFGQISAQRVALEVNRLSGSGPDAGAFLEQLITRRELADNFCLWTDNYDSFDCAPAWARQTLLQHARDSRPYLYSTDEFEHARTHDPLWNAAQKEMVLSGRMHGYLRMYWAKKILEWSPDPATAFQTALFLNDRYELDGRDPNGYTGVAWSICGVHDRPWTERPVFGQVRYMNDAGCRRKFDTAAYIRRWSAGPESLD